MSIQPPSKPQITQADLSVRLFGLGLDRVKYPLIVVGVRAYYKDSMGDKGKNDRGIYDDAIMLLTPNVCAAFNGNTDPSAQYRPGLACLKPGVYYAHRFDYHNGKYMAICQRVGKVIVHRDGTDDVKPGTLHPSYGRCLGEGYWEGEFGINIHKGGYGTTSSLGCQTVPPGDQWDAFIALATCEAKRLYGDRWRKTTVPYVLLDFAA